MGGDDVVVGDGNVVPDRLLDAGYSLGWAGFRQGERARWRTGPDTGAAAWLMAMVVISTSPRPGAGPSVTGLHGVSSVTGVHGVSSVTGVCTVLSLTGVCTVPGVTRVLAGCAGRGCFGTRRRRGAVVMCAGPHAGHPGRQGQV